MSLLKEIYKPIFFAITSIFYWVVNAKNWLKEISEITEYIGTILASILTFVTIVYLIIKIRGAYLDNKKKERK